MKKKICKKAALCVCAAEMAFQGVFTSYGAWQSNGSQWQYRMPDTGALVKSSWYQAEGEWYWFDQEGFMKTGWHLDTDGQWYFLNPVSDGTRGKMLTGWQWIDGYCYYLSEKTDDKYPKGAMYAGERTSDGYRVNKSGAWTDESGSLVYRPGKGIATAKEKGSKGRTRGLIIKSGDGVSSGRSQQAGPAAAEKNDFNQETVETTENRAEESSKNGKDGDPDENAETGNDPKEDREEKTGSSPEIKFTGQPPIGNKADGKAETDSESNADQTQGSAGENQVRWKIHFTDSSTHQLQLAPSKSGTIAEGTDLTINFQSKIVDSENRIWKSIQQAPYVITVTGPQDRIIYVEYKECGKAAEEADPWREEKEHLQEFMELAKKQELLFSDSILGGLPDSRFLAENKDICDMRLKSVAAKTEPGENKTFYVIGKNYIPEGSVLAEVYGDNLEYSNTVEGKVTLKEDVYILSRFQIYKKAPAYEEEHVWSPGEKQHWNVGDVQQRDLDGVTYRFRCIDQNYGDETDSGRQKALFLCDSVIPADTGSFYSYEKKTDGTYGYEFYPGPVVSFGDSDSYKHSRIRAWLKGAEQDFTDAAGIPTGVNYAYEGSTKPWSTKEPSQHQLKPFYIGSQAMIDRLFILSVDEAVKYSSWLWKFNGSEKENPESQQSAFCKGYWLRNPSAQKGEANVYIVDLAERNIHSEKVKPDGESGDLELDVTGTTGVRPAFTVNQR